jgi:hypothetical protein
MGKFAFVVAVIVIPLAVMQELENIYVLAKYVSTSCHPFPYCLPSDTPDEPEDDQSYVMRR